MTEKKLPDDSQFDLSRREVISGVLAGGIGVLLPASSADAASPPAPRSPAEFIPENDYPYFGYVPEDCCQNSRT